MICLIFTYVTIVTSAISSLRLITYRGGDRFKRPYSVAAYLLMVCLTSQSIYLFFYMTPVGFWQAGVSSLLMVSLLLSRGNVSCFFRGYHEHT